MCTSDITSWLKAAHRHVVAELLLMPESERSLLVGSDYSPTSTPIQLQWADERIESAQSLILEHSGGERSGAEFGAYAIARVTRPMGFPELPANALEWCRVVYALAFEQTTRAVASLLWKESDDD